jgi:photosynthetic reaction center cytochrome c subunit
VPFLRSFAVAVRKFIPSSNILKKKLLVLSTAGAFLASFSGSDHQGTAFAQAPPKTAVLGETSDQHFKNVTVLKGIPVDEFMGTMGLFSAALSFCCKDCHTGAGTSNPKWEDDPPRKITARRMAQMVTNINKESFNGRQVVTCWTCHRGSPSPAITPPIDTIYGDAVFTPTDVLPVANTATAGTPPADQILDKYVQALGGADALSKITSYTASGTSHLFGEVQEDPTEISAKAPGLLVTVVHQREGDVARTFDGREAWVMLPLTVVGQYPLNGSMLEGAKLDAQMAFPGGLKQFFTSWRVTYPSVVDGKPVYVVQGAGANGLIATFYFDKQTSLLTRMVRYAASTMGRVPTQIDYSDYRPVNGVMMAYKWTYSWISGREEYTLTSVQPNVPVDAAKFAKPVQVQRTRQ